MAACNCCGCDADSPTESLPTMPIEIRELVIRAVVSPDGGPAGQGLPDASPQQPAVAPLDVDQLVQECVRQVMRMLARERDR